MTVLFAVAMGYFEGTIVVYLRELYYPEGFSFPLRPVTARILLIELAREAATIVMLGAVSFLAGKRRWERFGYFLILFGIWDIFYYIWLRIVIGWPLSIYDFDILFLIPVPWVGPVIAPSLVAIVMTIAGIVITRFEFFGFRFRATRGAWILAFAATTAILYSFMRDPDAGFGRAEPEPYRYTLLAAGIVCYCLSLGLSIRETLHSGDADGIVSSRRDIPL